MIESFKNDDGSYFQTIRKFLLKNQGYVFNHFSNGPDSEYNKLHKFDCSSLPKKGENNATYYEKICSDDFYELFDFITNKYGKLNEYFSYCRTCNPSS